MGETTGIQWTDHTFNPWIGCTKVSAECDHCYAESGSKRLAAQHRLTLWGEASDRYMTGESYWQQPARWERAAMRDGVRRKVFCASYSDVFEDRKDLVGARRRLMDTILATPRLDWLLLSKRPENMIRLGWGLRGCPHNVWAGTTVGVRSSLDRIGDLRYVPARMRFVSAEPLLEDLGAINLTGIGWVIIGGELAHPTDAIRPDRRAHRHPGTKPRASTLDEPAHVLTTRDSSGDGSTLSLLEGPNHRPSVADAPVRTLTRNTHGDGALLVNDKHPVNQLDAPSFTVTTKGDGRGAQGSCVLAVLSGHAIKLSEKAAAILQGFPPGWSFCGATKRARWAQIGMAMPPPFGEAVARSIARQMADSAEAAE